MSRSLRGMAALWPGQTTVLCFVSSPPDLLSASAARRCVVCQCDFEASDELTLLPCNHAYHHGCLAAWLADNKVGLCVAGCRLQAGAERQHARTIWHTVGCYDWVQLCEVGRLTGG